MKKLSHTWWVSDVKPRGHGKGGVRVFITTETTQYSWWGREKGKIQRTTEFTNWHDYRGSFKYCEACEHDYVRRSNKDYGWEYLYHTPCEEYPHNPNLTTRMIEDMADEWFVANGKTCDGTWQSRK